MGSTPTPPAVASASSVAQGQQAANNQAQISSAVNQNTPYGSLDYTFGTGPNGALTLTANQSLTPQEQSLLGTLQGTQQEAGTAGQSLLASGNYGAGAPDLSTDTNSIVNQNLSNYTNYLSPFFTQQTNQLDNQLRNQGLQPGTEAYNNAKNNLSQSQDQAVSGYLAQMEPQAYNQAVSTYELPLSTAGSLAQLGSPVGYGSSNVNTPTQQPVNYAGIVGQQGNLANQQYQQQVQQNSGLLGGLASIGSSIAGGPIGSSIGSGIGSLFGSADAGLGSWAPLIFAA